MSLTPRTQDELTRSFKLIRDSLIDQITELSTKKKPSYSIDGQSVDWAEYLKYLMAQLKDVNGQIALFDDFPEQTSTMYT